MPASARSSEEDQGTGPVTKGESGLRILLYGSDARTAAMVRACAESAAKPELFAYSTLRIPTLLEGCAQVEIAGTTLADLGAMTSFAAAVRPDLVIIGPEEPLANGLVDELERVGVPCFGPRKELARVEASKSWARELVQKHAIDGNPSHRSFVSTDGLRRYLDHLGDFVVKPDGLTGGKGVRVLGEHLGSVEAAYDYAAFLIAENGCVVIEERLEGEEFSLQSITDGEAVVHCPPVQDHKRAFEGDTGPNTGGMGSYSGDDLSLPFIDAAELRAAEAINEAVVRALEVETGQPYRGVLYGGFMVTRSGVRLIEYNCRFGDPEAMNVLPLLRTDFVEICLAVANGRLSEIHVEFEAKATVCKYVVPKNYPSGGSDGEQILLPDSVVSDPNVRCYWAAVNAEGARVVMTGSRALAVVGIGDSLVEAEQYAESAATRVEGPVRHRRDIGTPALIEARISHLRALRT